MSHTNETNKSKPFIQLKSKLIPTKITGYNSDKNLNSDTSKYKSAKLAYCATILKEKSLPPALIQFLLEHNLHHKELPGLNYSETLKELEDYISSKKTRINTPKPLLKTIAILIVSKYPKTYLKDNKTFRIKIGRAARQILTLFFLKGNTPDDIETKFPFTLGYTKKCMIEDLLQKIKTTPDFPYDYLNLFVRNPDQFLINKYSEEEQEISKLAKDLQEKCGLTKPVAELILLPKLLNPNKSLNPFFNLLNHIDPKICLDVSDFNPTTLAEEAIQTNSSPEKVLNKYLTKKINESKETCLYFNFDSETLDYALLQISIIALLLQNNMPFKNPYIISIITQNIIPRILGKNLGKKACTIIKEPRLLPNKPDITKLYPHKQKVLSLQIPDLIPIQKTLETYTNLSVKTQTKKQSSLIHKFAQSLYQIYEQKDQNLNEEENHNLNKTKLLQENCNFTKTAAELLMNLTKQFYKKDEPLNPFEPCHQIKNLPPEQINPKVLTNTADFNPTQLIEKTIQTKKTIYETLQNYINEKIKESDETKTLFLYTKANFKVALTQLAITALSHPEITNHPNLFQDAKKTILVGTKNFQKQEIEQKINLIKEETENKKDKTKIPDITKTENLYTKQNLNDQQVQTQKIEKTEKKKLIKINKLIPDQHYQKKNQNNLTTSLTQTKINLQDQNPTEQMTKIYEELIQTINENKKHKDQNLETKKEQTPNPVQI